MRKKKMTRMPGPRPMDENEDFQLEGIEEVPDNLLDGMQTIMQEAEDSGMSNEFFAYVKVPMDYLCGRLGLTPKQVTLLAVIMEEGYQNNVSLKDIAHYLDTTNLFLLSQSAEIEGLERLRFLRKTERRGEVGYYVPEEVYDAFKHDQKYSYEPKVLDSDKELIRVLDRMLCTINNSWGDREYSEFDCELVDLFKANAHLRLGKYLGGVQRKLNAVDFRVFLLMSMFWIRDGEVELHEGNITMMFVSRFDFRSIMADIKSGTSALVKKKLVQLSAEGDMAEEDKISLVPKVRKTLTPNRSCDGDSAGDNRHLTSCKEIVEKELFYNADISDEVDRLRSLLLPDQTDQVLQRLKASGMRGGFTCLLYGAPGTGKTETVLQLAKACGRDIFQVEVSQLRTKWYGESERLVKGIFDEYRQVVRKSKTAPIMFFNEADAIFNQRMEKAQYSTDKAENALQNIILQEMETLDGILIATTNLQNNLDSAFERRFLYKLRLDKPTTEVKARIWRSMLADLSEEDSLCLAREFDFSGGQIENIARKRFIDEVLTGHKLDLEGLQKLCRHELLGEDSKTRDIGFLHRDRV